jgi:hypothetical protein
VILLAQPGEDGLVGGLVAEQGEDRIAGESEDEEVDEQRRPEEDGMICRTRRRT